MIIQSPHNPNIYATVCDMPDGVRVAFWQREPKRRESSGSARFVGGALIDLPFHLILDKVHDLLAAER